MRTSSRSSRRTGSNRNSKLHSAIAPAAAASVDERRPLRRRSSANGLSHSTALPACERDAHVRGVQERRRVHAHEVDVGARDRGARPRRRRAATRRRPPRSRRSRRTPARPPGRRTRCRSRRPSTSLPHHLGRVGVHRQMEAPQARVRERAEAERDQHGADPDVAAEQRTRPRARCTRAPCARSRAVPARGDRGHQPVARPGPEPGADVEAAAEPEARRSRAASNGMRTASVCCVGDQRRGRGSR